MPQLEPLLDHLCPGPEQVRASMAALKQQGAESNNHAPSARTHGAEGRGSGGAMGGEGDRAHRADDGSAHREAKVSCIEFQTIIVPSTSLTRHRIQPYLRLKWALKPRQSRYQSSGRSFITKETFIGVDQNGITKSKGATFLRVPRAGTNTHANRKRTRKHKHVRAHTHTPP